MKRDGIVSAAALGVYAVARRLGLLRSRLGEAIYMRAYMSYKLHVEDPLSALLKRYPELARGGHVIDVGANIGYTAILFSRYIDERFRVHAFEPEAVNIQRLHRNISRFRRSNIVVHECAVGKTNGTAKLWVNESHPGDHRVLTSRLEGNVRGGSVDVVMSSLDEAWRSFLHSEPVALVKIDVQGYEHDVVEGMEALIAAARPAIIFEHDPRLNEAMGFDALAVPHALIANGYTLHSIAQDGRRVPLKLAAMKEMNTYGDVVALPQERGVSGE